MVQHMQLRDEGVSVHVSRPALRQRTLVALQKEKEEAG